MSKYTQGQHAIPRYPKGRHAIERFPLGAHGVSHPCTWYIKREASKRSMPAVALLLTTSLGAGTVGVPCARLRTSLPRFPSYTRSSAMPTTRCSSLTSALACLSMC